MGLDNNNGTFTTPLISKNPSKKNQQTFSNGIQFGSNVTVKYDEQNVAGKRLSWKDLFPQILASVTAFTLVTQPGINMVYSNIFLNHYEFTDVSELSWLTGVLVLCTPIGAIVIGMIMDRVGRKNAILLTCVPLLMSWSIASVARPENMHLIYACRFFAGIGGGMTSMVVVYVSEIAHSSYRQVLLSLNSVFFSLGVLIATTVGTLFQWQAINVTFFVFTALTTVLLAVFLPESPVWLSKFRAERVYEARNALKRIYPRNDQVFAEEWDRLYYMRPPAVPDRTVSLLLRPSPSPSPSVTLLGGLQPHDRRRRRGRVRRFWWCRWWLHRWSSQPPTVVRPVRVLAVVFLLQQLSGCYPVIFYAVPVIRSIMGTEGDGGPTRMDTLITMGVVRLLTSVVACALSQHVGRRPLLIGSSLAMAFSAAMVALTCPSSADNVVQSAAARTPILPLVGVAAFVCSGSAGVLVFPWTLIGELLPVSARAMAGSVLVSYAYALMFVVLKAFPYFVASVDGGGGGSVAVAFGGFAAASLALAAYTHVYLPETLGKRFHEIEEYFADPNPVPVPNVKNQSAPS